MKQADLDAIKLAAAEQFGIVGVDDADDFREMLRVNPSSLNAVDRAAFDMRVGSVAQQLESGGHPKARFLIASYVLFALIAWFIWHPVAFVIAISGLAGIRRFAIRHADFWQPTAAIAIGAVYGITLAVSYDSVRRT